MDSPQCVVAFDAAVEDLLLNALILTTPSFYLPFKLEVGAGAMGTGVVQLQDRPCSLS